MQREPHSTFTAIEIAAVCTLFTFLLAGCSDLIKGNDSASITPIAAYCPYLPSRTFSEPVTISGSAVYEDRTDGNGAVAASPRPVRYAEVRVTDAAGKLVQCAETDASGMFSFELPKDGSTYSIAVTSRSNNSKNSAYVMSDPNTNTLHAVTQTVQATAEAGLSALTFRAKATDTQEAGAFNILDQILNAQDYLRTTTSGCDVASNPNYFPGCSPYTVAPVVNVYWAPGVNPGKYIGVSGGISYYLGGERKLFVLGGIDGNTSSADMDHFDDSVIVHEYGHFLEDQFGKPDSPGGSHNGNSIIDPRLAWGEGWSNFFQAAVLGRPIYRDTYGNVDCHPTAPAICSGIGIQESLDSPTLDIPSGSGGSGEGNFREFSVARVLWNAIRTPSPITDFAEIWGVVTGRSSGMAALSDPFKSVGRFHKIQVAASRSNWSALRTAEYQVGDLSTYATPITLTAESGCTSSPVTMNVVKKTGDTGDFATADQFRNSDFYSYTHGGGLLTITLSSTDTTIDLDLYLLKAGYVFGNSADWAATSLGDTPNESFSVNVPAGTYMIHVMADTGTFEGKPRSTPFTHTLQYRLNVNGQTACPGN